MKVCFRGVWSSIFVAMLWIYVRGESEVLWVWGFSPLVSLKSFGEWFLYLFWRVILISILLDLFGGR